MKHKLQMENQSKKLGGAAVEGKKGHRECGI